MNETPDNLSLAGSSLRAPDILLQHPPSPAWLCRPYMPRRTIPFLSPWSAAAAAAPARPGNALSVKNKGPITLTAMADVFDDRLKGSYSEIKKKLRGLRRCAAGQKVHRL